MCPLKRQLGATTAFRGKYKKGNIIEFADDLVCICEDDVELTLVIQGFEGLNMEWDTELIKAKSHMLAREGEDLIGWVQVRQTAK
jgi:hypothetical protein